MYSIVQDVTTGKQQQGWIRRLSDSAFIPTSEENRDYKDFLAWQKAGGVLQQKDPMYTPYKPAEITKTDLQAQLDVLTKQVESLPEG